jgi:hypothetical protein
MGGEGMMHGADRRGSNRRRGALAAFLVILAVCAATAALALDTRGTGIPPMALWAVTVLAVVAAFPLLWIRRKTNL